MIGFIILMAFIMLVLYGYFANIFHLATSKGAASGLSIVRGIGIIIAPLGVVMGFIGNPTDEKGNENEAKED